MEYVWRVKRPGDKNGIFLVILGHLLVLAIGAGRPLTVAHWTSALHCLCVCSYHHVSENMKILQSFLTLLDIC